MRTWITTILVNRCRDQLRRARLRRMLPQDWFGRRAHPDTPEVVDTVAEALQRQRLLGLVDQLEDRYRLPMLLHYIADFSANDIAQVMTLTPSAVYARLNVARQRVRASLRDATPAEIQEWQAGLC